MLNGKLSEREEMQRFESEFLLSLPSEYVNFEQWEQMYADISCGIEDDNYFCTLLWNTWDKGGELRDCSRPENFVPSPSNQKYSQYY